MNKHMLILPVMLVTATALLLFSISLPEEGEGPAVIASGTPEPVESNASTLPSGSPKPANSVAPKPTPTPSPSPTASQLPAFGIAATTPDAVLREAQVHAGRVDPFKSVFAPDLPEFDPAIEPEQMALPNLPELPAMPNDGPPNPPVVIRPIPDPVVDPPVDIPPPEPPLEQGLVLKGLIDGGLDPVALVEVNGRTEMVRVGERLPGNILVTSIHYDGKYIKISRGRQTATLQLAIPQSPTY